MVRLSASLLLSIVLLFAAHAGAQQSNWQTKECGSPGISLPSGLKGQCATWVGPTLQGGTVDCHFSEFSVYSPSGPAPRFQVTVRVARGSNCSIGGAMTTDQVKQRISPYVREQGINWTDPQNLSDGSMVAFFDSKDAKRDGRCVMFYKRGPPQNGRGALGPRSAYYGYLCKAPGEPFDLVSVANLLSDISSDY